MTNSISNIGGIQKFSSYMGGICLSCGNVIINCECEKDKKGENLKDTKFSELLDIKKKQLEDKESHSSNLKRIIGNNNSNIWAVLLNNDN